MKNWLLLALLFGWLAFDSTKNNVLNNIKFRFGGVFFDGINANGSIRIGVRLIIDNNTPLSMPIDNFKGMVYFKETAFAPLMQQESGVVQASASTTINYVLPMGENQFIQMFGSIQKAVDFFKSAAAGGNFRLKGQITFRIANIVYYQDIDQVF